MYVKHTKFQTVISKEKRGSKSNMGLTKTEIFNLQSFFNINLLALGKPFD